MSGALDADLIDRSLSDDTRKLLERLEVLDEVASTNTWLLERARRKAGRIEVVLAEHQTAGRGRYSRIWHSPPMTGLTFSMGYTFQRGPQNLSGLTLVIGVAVANALQQLGANGHGLKWPNDIMAGGKKLGGILTDAMTGAGTSITMVCGVGMNIDLSAAGSDDPITELPKPITDLRSCMDAPRSRNTVAAALIDEMQRAVIRFETEGIEPFLAAWNDYDWLRGKHVVVEMPDSVIDGTADGIDGTGALRVLTEHGRRRVFTGTVQLPDEGAGAK
ncbi:MAG: biotin--[acetyl-CoA-carboxylase] ligase [Woeseia sp.]